MIKKCFMWQSYARACRWKENALQWNIFLCYFWTMSVMKGYDKVIVNTVFLTSTCPPSTSTTLLPHQPNTGWCLFTPPPLAHLFIGSFVHAQSGSALQHSASWSCLMCVIRCVLALSSLWELELCPSSACWQPAAWTVWSSSHCAACVSVTSGLHRFVLTGNLWEPLPTKLYNKGFLGI